MFHPFSLCPPAHATGHSAGHGHSVRPLASSAQASLVRALAATALASVAGGAFAQTVTVTEFNIFQPVFTEVFNDRIGNSRFFNGPNTDRVRLSTFVSPSPDSDSVPVMGSSGNLFQSTNGALTSVSITHPSFAPTVRDLVFVGLTSGLGGGRNEYTTTFNRAAGTVAPLLDAWDATPFVVTVKNPGAPTGVTSVTYNAPDFDRNALPAFVTDLTLTGGGLNPRLDWKVPASGTTPTAVSIQVRRIDGESADRTRITSATLVHTRTLAPTATTYTLNEVFSNASRPGFPAGLEVGQRYEVSVQLDTSSGGHLQGRSRTFFEFKPLPSGNNNVSVFLPSVGLNGVFKFDIDVTQGEKVAIDPIVAVGYEYQIGAGNPLFRSLTLPVVGDGSYDLYLFDGVNYSFQTVVQAGAEYFFAAGGVDRFQVRGIETSAGLDPFDTTAFVTTLTFAGDGRFTGTMTPLTQTVAAVPEPETYALMLLGLGAVGFSARRRARAKSD